MVVDLPESTWPITADDEDGSAMADKGVLTDDVNVGLVLSHFLKTGK